MNYTYDDLLTDINMNAYNSPTLPTGTQYTMFVRQIINAIRKWENRRGVLWDELRADAPNAATLSATTTTIDLPDDFMFMFDGVIRILYSGSTTPQPIPVKKLSEKTLNPSLNEREVYITGNPRDGYQLLLGWTITTGSPDVGAKISYTYYRRASYPTLDSSGALENPDDFPEMSNPIYIMEYSVASISAPFNPNLFTIYDGRADDSMNQMIIANSSNANYEDNYDKDIDSLTGSTKHYWDRLKSDFYSR